MSREEQINRDIEKLTKELTSSLNEAQIVVLDTLLNLLESRYIIAELKALGVEK